jgi:hypothetical protein
VWQSLVPSMLNLEFPILSMLFDKVFPNLKTSENAGQNGKFAVPVAVLDRLNSNLEDVD